MNSRIRNKLQLLRQTGKKALITYITATIDLIPLVAPTSDDRIQEIVSNAEGFVYCISSMRVTGKREDFQRNLEEFIQQIRKYTDIPLAIDFGIGNAAMVSKLKGLCEGIIVGSAIIEEIEFGLQDGTSEERVFSCV